MSRFRVWFCRVFLGRTPYFWEDFGPDLKRRGYYVLHKDGSRGLFFDEHGEMFI